MEELQKIKRMIRNFQREKDQIHRNIDGVVAQDILKELKNLAAEVTLQVKALEEFGDDVWFIAEVRIATAMQRANEMKKTVYETANVLI